MQVVTERINQLYIHNVRLTWGRRYLCRHRLLDTSWPWVSAPRPEKQVQRFRPSRYCTRLVGRDNISSLNTNKLRCTAASAVIAFLSLLGLSCWRLSLRSGNTSAIVQVTIKLGRQSVQGASWFWASAPQPRYKNAVVHFHQTWVLPPPSSVAGRFLV